MVGWGGAGGARGAAPPSTTTGRCCVRRTCAMPFCSCSAFPPRPSLFVILSEAKNLKRGRRARGEVVSRVEQAGEGVLVLDFVLERLAHDVHGDGVVHVHLLEQVVRELDGVALALDAVLEHTLPVGGVLGR